MTGPRQYDTRDQAAAAWLRRAKLAGLVVASGGGWWRVAGRARPIGQGLGRLGAHLERSGILVRVPARDQAAQTGLWAWELRSQFATTEEARQA